MRTILFAISIIATVPILQSCDMLFGPSEESRSLSLMPFLANETDATSGLTLTVSTSWDMAKDSTNVSFRPSDLHKNEPVGDLAIMVFRCEEPNKDEAACIKRWATHHFSEDDSSLTRETLPTGGQWVVSHGVGEKGGKQKSDKDHLDARLYVFDPASGRLANAHFKLNPDTLKYHDAYKKASETLTFSGTK